MWPAVQLCAQVVPAWACTGHVEPLGMKGLCPSDDLFWQRMTAAEGASLSLHHASCSSFSPSLSPSSRL